VAEAASATVVLFSDIGCPWATLAVHRLRQARTRLGLVDRVVIDHRPFPLEVANNRPTPKRTLDAEIPVVGALTPDAGFRMWQGGAEEWPVTTLLALEAVQAAQDQGAAAAEDLDYGLRRAFFVDSRCISMRHVILDVARACERVDADALAIALDEGRARRRMMAAGLAALDSDDVQGSPHLFLPDGTAHHNPGIEMHWEGAHGEGFPVVDRDDPSIYDDILRRAASRAA
jgi:predicted DsbA family dithiol-disulfide isomerase